MAHSRNTPKRPWLNREVIVAAIVALVSVLAGVWDELAAIELKNFLGDWYRSWMPVVVLAVALAVGVWAAIRGVRNAKSEPDGQVGPSTAVTQTDVTNSPVAVNTTATGTVAAGNLAAGRDVVVGNVTNYFSQPVPQYRDAVVRYFWEYLGRAPAPADIDWHAGQGWSIKQINDRIYNSPEAQARRASGRSLNEPQRREAVVRYFREYLGREPKPADIDWHAGQHWSIEQMATHIYNTPEAQALRASKQEMS